MRRHYCLVDGSGFMHRAHSVAGLGKETNKEPPSRLAASPPDVPRPSMTAVLFVQMFRKMLRRTQAGQHPPTHWMVAFDPSREALWRRTVSPAYKANRSETDPALRMQMPFMEAYCAEAGLNPVKAPHHEADDLLATYAHLAAAEGYRVTVVSSDKDVLQLVSPGIRVWDPKTDAFHTPATIQEKFGIPVEKFRDYLAFMGDRGDGVSGVRGIGKKAAVGLLGGPWSVEEMMENPEILEKENPRWARLLKEGKEDWRLARQLVTLDGVGCPRPLNMGTWTPTSAAHALEATQIWLATHASQAKGESR